MVSENFDWAAVTAFVEFEAALRENFPAQAWMLDHEELGPIISQAVQEEWDPDTLLGKIAKSQWGLDRTDAEEAWDILEGSNPEEAADQLADRRRDLEQRAAALGASLSDEQLDTLARDWIRSDLDDFEVAGLIVEQTAEFEAGEFTAGMTAVRETAAAYMLPVTDAEADELTRAIVSGEITAANIAETFKLRAKGKFPSLAELIDGGTNLSDYFSDHKSTIAEMMGQDVDAVDLVNDSRWAPVLGFAAEPGSAPRPMAAHEVAQFVRTKNEYYQTPGGRSELDNNRLRLQSAMGLR